MFKYIIITIASLINIVLSYHESNGQLINYYQDKMSIRWKSFVDTRADLRNSINKENPTIFSEKSIAITLTVEPSDK